MKNNYFYNTIKDINNTSPAELLGSKDLIWFIIFLLIASLYLVSIALSWAYYSLISRGTSFRSFKEMQAFKWTIFCAGFIFALGVFALLLLGSIKYEVWHELGRVW